MNYKFFTTFGLIVCMYTGVKADPSKPVEKVQTISSTLKIGYADIGYLFENLPEAKKSNADFQSFQKQLDSQKQAKAKEFQEKYAALQDELQTLTEAQKKQKFSELSALERAFKELEAQEYGKLQEKHKVLMQPIHDKIQEVVDKVAAEKGYTFIFNKNVEMAPILLFGEKSFDLSELVLGQLKELAPKPSELPVVGVKPDSTKKLPARGVKSAKKK